MNNAVAGDSTWPPRDPGIYPHPDEPGHVLVVQPDGECKTIGRWCPHNPDTDLQHFGAVDGDHLICRHKAHRWLISDGTYCGIGTLADLTMSSVGHAEVVIALASEPSVPTDLPAEDLPPAVFDEAQSAVSNLRLAAGEMLRRGMSHPNAQKAISRAGVAVVELRRTLHGHGVTIGEAESVAVAANETRTPEQAELAVIYDAHFGIRRFTTLTRAQHVLGILPSVEAMLHDIANDPIQANYAGTIIEMCARLIEGDAR